MHATYANWQRVSPANIHWALKTYILIASAASGKRQVVVVVVVVVSIILYLIVCRYISYAAECKSVLLCYASQTKLTNVSQTLTSNQKGSVMLKCLWNKWSKIIYTLVDCICETVIELSWKWVGGPISARSSLRIFDSPLRRWLLLRSALLSKLTSERNNKVTQLNSKKIVYEYHFEVVKTLHIMSLFEYVNPLHKIYTSCSFDLTPC